MTSAARLQSSVPALVATALLTLLSGCTAAREGLRPKRELPPYRIEPWNFGGVDGRRVVSEHYEIFSTLSDERLLGAFPELMEGGFAFYRGLVPPGRESKRKMRIYLFATRPQWVQFTKRFAGPRAASFLRIRNGGYSERGVTAIKFVSHQTTFPIMAHEGFHQYLYHYVGRWAPAWLNEGLAVACEGQRWEGMRLVSFDLRHNPVRRNRLADAILRKEMFPLRELLATHAGRVIQRSTRAVGTYYAQLWALANFLREGQDGKYADGFARLLANLPSLGPRGVEHASSHDQRAGSIGEGVFRKYITDELEQFESEYRLFIRRWVVGAP